MVGNPLHGVYSEQSRGAQDKPRIGFIGAGTVGTALAYRLSQLGYPVVGVASRTLASAESLARRVQGCQAYPKVPDVADAADLVFLTTPDDAIAQVAGQVRWRAGQMVVHCSGADSAELLEPAQAAGAMVGVFHPLQTFASVEQAIANLPGSTFAVEGQGGILAVLQEMAQSLGGRWVVLQPQDKVLYHLAAVLASNYTITLTKLASDLWELFGADAREATQALLPLMRGTLNNIEEIGIPGCLTGPIARGDLGTIQKHLSAMERSAPWLLPLYRELGLQTIPIAQAKGKVEEERAEELRAVLNAVPCNA